MASHSIEEVIQDADPDATAPLAHGSHHPPLVGLGVITLYAGNCVPAAPAPHYSQTQKTGSQKYSPSSQTAYAPGTNHSASLNPSLSHSF